MLSRQHAAELQTNCMVAVLAPVHMIEAARLPRVFPVALGYRSPTL